MRYIPNPDVVSTQLEDNESVLLNLKTRKYYTINETGSVIWNCVNEGMTDSDIAARLSTEFEIDEAGARSHIDQFLGRLAMDGMVTIDEG